MCECTCVWVWVMGRVGERPNNLPLKKELLRKFMDSLSRIARVVYDWNSNKHTLFSSATKVMIFKLLSSCLFNTKDIYLSMCGLIMKNKHPVSLCLTKEVKQDTCCVIDEEFLSEISRKSTMYWSGQQQSMTNEWMSNKLSMP